MVIRKHVLRSLSMVTLVIMAQWLFGQNIILTTQADVNAFDPAITVVNGDLTIGNSGSADPITNLAPLAAIVEVTGTLFISETSLASFQGLGALKNVGKYFYVQHNAHLKSTEGLTSLLTIGKTMDFLANDSLVTLTGPGALTSIGKELLIRSNALLKYINGFDNLISVVENISILENASLTDIDGFNAIISVEGNLLMENNTYLFAISGFKKMTEVMGDLTLSKSRIPILDFLYHLEDIGGKLTIDAIDFLHEIPDLPNLKHTGGLDIRSNHLLDDIAGFNGLLTIGTLQVYANNISTISGFKNLQAIESGMNISSNDYLTEIIGFSALETAESITFILNPALENFDGFAHLKSVTFSLQFTFNDAMTDVNAFQGVTDMENLHFDGCDNLTNLDGFSNLLSLYTLSISGGEKLEKIRLPKLRRIDHNLDVSGLPALKIFEFPVLDTIVGELGINNTGLEDLNGLSNLKFIGYQVDITRNEMLLHLNGLKNLNHVGGSFDLSRNTNLSDCCGITQLLITPGAIEASTSISQNNTGCDSKIEVIADSRCTHVVNDANVDCIWNLNEQRLAGRFAILSPGNLVLTSNAVGMFDLSHLSAGQYTLQIDTFGPWSSLCNIERVFEVSQDGDIPEFEPFALHATNPCSYPSVSVNMPFTRPGFQNLPIIVKVCNDTRATGLMEDPFVEVTLDTLLTFQSASVSGIIIAPHVYRFKLKDLNPGECTQIKILVMLSSNAELGQSLCLKTELTPGDSCVFNNERFELTSPNTGCTEPYAGSDIAVSGYCENDSIHFAIKNVASVPTECRVPLRLFRDELLIWKDSIFLEGNSIHTETFFADGRTFRLEADQHPNHPWLSRPNVSIERCGDLAKWTPGKVNAFYQDDLSPLVDITCVEVNGSFDPNDKSASPRGLGALHNILANEPLDYTIRFQNTGTDTAFTVVIRDTLDVDLDIFSVKPGVASHPYAFSMQGPRVLECEFQNIQLPDSSTNEAGSHGFITFQVRQNLNLPVGTLISNRASIYFDFNEPIFTNTVTHVISNLDDLVSSVPPDPQLSETDGRIVPNPSGGSFDLVFDDVKSDIHVQMFNSTGQLIHKGQYSDSRTIHLNSGNIPGLYFIHVFIPGERSFVLKAVVK